MLNAQVIPADRTYNWQEAGYPGDFPEPSLVLDIATYGAIPNDTIDDKPAINDAITALGGQQGVILFDAGEYLLESDLNLPDSVILRGRHADSTTLKFSLGTTGANCINIRGSQSGNFVSVTSGLEIGSQALVVSDPVGFSAGDYIELRQENDSSWDSQPANWAAYSIGQMLIIEEVIADTLVLKQALRFTYDTLLNPEVQRITPRHEVGIECLRMTREGLPATGGPANIYFDYAANCWVKGLESDKSVGSHILLDASIHVEIRGSYIHHAFEYTGSGTRGYGVTFIQHASECLLEDNIFQFLRHSMMIKQGANGNVIGYNYSREPNRAEFPSNAGGDISVHGHYPFANLFEGNIVQNLHIDQTWGPSGPHNTYFRNRMELVGILMTSAESNAQSFVGNEVSNPNLLFGQYLLVGTDHVLWGNNVKGVINPAGTEALEDSSYYLSEQPAFWDISDPWPSIGPSNTLDQYTIPAKDRWDAGGILTVCGNEPEEPPTSIESSLELEGISLESVYPNPFRDQFTIRLNSQTVTELTLELYDIHGKLSLKRMISTGVGQQTHNIQLSNGLPQGVYLLRLMGEKGNIALQLLHME